MLQKAPDDAGDMDILRFTGHTRQDAADAADNELYFHARAGRLRQFVNDLALGDGVRLDADIAVFAKCDLPVDVFKQHGLDAERRDAELLIFPVQLVNEHIPEKRRRVLTDCRVSGHEAEICIHGVGLFVIVAGADLRKISGFVPIAKRDDA